jgi:hypothetical protein
VTVPWPWNFEGCQLVRVLPSKSGSPGGAPGVCDRAVTLPASRTVTVKVVTNVLGRGVRMRRFYFGIMRRIDVS